MVSCLRIEWVVMDREIIHPFFFMYNREPVLPVDLKYGLNSASSYNGPFDQDMFEAVSALANTIREDIHEASKRNIKKAQEKQKRDFDRRHLTNGDMIEKVESFEIDG